MEVLHEDGLYRHLRFTKGGSQCYRFDIHTWPGFLCICQDMGTYVFSRTPDMFDFFRLKDNDWSKKHIINTGYWAEKLQAVDRDSARGDGSGATEFSQEKFAEHVKEEYDNFCEGLADHDEDELTEAFDDDRSMKSQLAELWECLESEVIAQSYDGQLRAYDAAMGFEWQDDNGNLAFDMHDFWDHNCTEYTFHFIWLLHAIVYGIGEYDKLNLVNDT